MADGISISGMNSGTWFADSPVIIKVEGLDTYWPKKNGKPSSPFNVVRVEIIHNSKVYGEVKEDTGGAASIEFDISSALRAIWAEENFSNEVSKANKAAKGSNNHDDEYVWTSARYRHEHMYHVYLEYVSDGILEKKDFELTGNNSYSVIGGMTEWERSLIDDDGDKSVTHWDKTNNRFGSASTKPVSSPEHIGNTSITSWVGVGASYTTGKYYASYAKQEADDGTKAANYEYRPHAPTVLRDSQEYVDFLFVNRRGAVETCSGLTKEAMEMGVSTQQYGRVEGPAFKPTRSLAALGSDGRRSWNMSSGYVTRDWAEWWASEFLGGKRKRWWMRWKGPGMTASKYVPVIVEPAKKSVTIYDRSKQNMPHVDFTVTLALEG